jgi:hypothetical protein
MPRYELEMFYKTTYNACRYVMRLPSSGRRMLPLERLPNLDSSLTRTHNPLHGNTNADCFR